MMSKKSYFLLIVFVMVFLVSCQQIGQIGKAGRASKSGPQKGSEFRTGTESLVLSFPEGTFNRLYERDNDVRLLVEIVNRGAYPQPDEREGLRGRIWIGGFDPNILELSPEEGSSLDDRALEGKSLINLEGGRSAVLFTGNVFQLPSGTSAYKTPIVVSASYLYKTTAAPMVCVDPKPRSTNIKEKVCDVSKFGNIAIPGGTGGPVIVSRVEEEVTSGNIIFRIELQNSGKGLVIGESDINKDPNVGYDWRDLNKVVIEDISVGNLEVTDCRPSVGEVVQLINNKGFIICRMRTAGINDVYTTPLNIRLRYGYSTSVKKDIEILKDIVFN